MPYKSKEKALSYKRQYRKTEKGRFSRRKERYKFKISFQEYLSLRDKQNNVCAICEKKENKKNLAIDHCHKTLKIRGLLCQKCNRGIGSFGDDPNLLLKASQYLL